MKELRNLELDVRRESLLSEMEMLSILGGAGDTSINNGTCVNNTECENNTTCTDNNICENNVTCRNNDIAKGNSGTCKGNWSGGQTQVNCTCSCIVNPECPVHTGTCQVHTGTCQVHTSNCEVHTSDCKVS